MTTNTIRKKLLDYISSADGKKIKAMYTLLENDINPSSGDEWDEVLDQEMVKRSKDFQSGIAKTYTWEETKHTAVVKHQAKRK